MLCRFRSSKKKTTSEKTFMINSAADKSNIGRVDSEIPLANVGEINVFDRFSQCQTFSEIASG